MKIFLFLAVLLAPLLSVAQNESDEITDSTVIIVSVNQGTLADIRTEQVVHFKKPAYFSFITDIPRDLAGFAKNSCRKGNYKAHLLIAGSTAVFLLADQVITNSMQTQLSNWGIHSTESFSPVVQVKLGGKETNFGKLPHNVNTAFYNLGQGSASMLLAGGFYLMGKIKKDNRALQTAKQLSEAFIALGLTTQVLKYATGRENPSDATIARGKWRPFPAWSSFQNNKTQYDAFPSGHLATFVSTVTIIGQNYPEKRWIKPVGYSLSGLIGLSMINNGVHWASDFPLGVALGYGFGRFISRKSHFTLVP